VVPETSSKYVSADDPRWDSPWQKSGDMIGFGYEAQMADEKQGDLWAQIIADHGTGEGFLRHEQLEELMPAKNCCPFLTGKSPVDRDGDRSHAREKALVDLDWDLVPTFSHTGDSMPAGRPKLLHPGRGAVAKVRLEWNEACRKKYTGQQTHSLWAPVGPCGTFERAGPFLSVDLSPFVCLFVGLFTGGECGVIRLSTTRPGLSSWGHGHEKRWKCSYEAGVALKVPSLNVLYG